MDARSRMAAYGRAVRAILDAQGAESRPPILCLDDAQKAALFSPRQISRLAGPALARPKADCGS